MTEDEALAVQRFGAWLRDPQSHCIICLKPKAEADVRVWKVHPVRGPVFYCGDHRRVPER